jgi:hypothetical protein
VHSIKTRDKVQKGARRNRSWKAGRKPSRVTCTVMKAEFKKALAMKNSLSYWRQAWRSLADPMTPTVYTCFT